MLEHWNKDNKLLRCSEEATIEKMRGRTTAKFHLMTSADEFAPESRCIMETRVSVSYPWTKQRIMDNMPKKNTGKIHGSCERRWKANCGQVCV